MDRIASIEIDVRVTACLGPDRLRPGGGATRQSGEADTQRGQEGTVLIRASPHALGAMLHRVGTRGNCLLGMLRAGLLGELVQPLYARAQKDDGHAYGASG